MSRPDPPLTLVTGASAGIGEACARRFAAEGHELALWARRGERLETLASQLSLRHGTTVHRAAVDVRDRAAVAAAAAALVDEAGVPDVLVNNAGLAAGLDLVHEGDPDDWDRMIDTNLKGLLNVTRAVLPGMVERDSGHVINIGSTAGHQVYPRGNVYNATKFGVKALTKGMNVDVAGTAVRVSSVDPGFVETEFSRVRFGGDGERADAVYEGFEPLKADDVADAVWYVASRPPHVNVFDLVIMPTAQRDAFVVDRDESEADG
ncbi:MAG TPA: SDR family NAD(P)-dependent oxidoreductase [Gemmatimonadota bacterium]|nr:SDR family NAD(P)-dependent oxidoreductase [Gemmatimonadota bacterium]